MEKTSKINKRTRMFIPDSRVVPASIATFWRKSWWIFSLTSFFCLYASIMHRYTMCSLEIVLFISKLNF